MGQVQFGAPVLELFETRPVWVPLYGHWVAVCGGLIETADLPGGFRAHVATYDVQRAFDVLAQPGSIFALVPETHRRARFMSDLEVWRDWHIVVKGLPPPSARTPWWQFMRRRRPAPAPEPQPMQAQLLPIHMERAFRTWDQAIAQHELFKWAVLGCSEEFLDELARRNNGALT